MIDASKDARSPTSSRSAWSQPVPCRRTARARVAPRSRRDRWTDRRSRRARLPARTRRRARAWQRRARASDEMPPARRTGEMSRAPAASCSAARAIRQPADDVAAIDERHRRRGLALIIELEAAIRAATRGIVDERAPARATRERRRSRGGARPQGGAWPRSSTACARSHRRRSRRPKARVRSDGRHRRTHRAS